jgi:hypothetical protein
VQCRFIPTLSPPPPPPTPSRCYRSARPDDGVNAFLYDAGRLQVF